MTVDAVTVKVQAEISLAWFKQHPELGVKVMTDFFAQHPHERWVTRVDQSRTGFMNLIAVLRGSGETTSLEA